MDKLTAILVSLLLVLVALTSSNVIEGKTVLTTNLKASSTTLKLHGRQACNLSDSSLACNNTLVQIQALIVQAYTGNPNDISTSTVTTLLNQFCASECLTPVLQYFNCLGLSIDADFYNNGYCGQSDGTYCFVVWLNGYAAGEQLVQTSCGLSTPCTSSCKQLLQDSVDYLGCCAASLYDVDDDVSLFSNLISPSQFSTCGVSLGDPCEDAQSSAVVSEVRFGLLVLFVMAAILAVL